MINARSETARVKPYFRNAWKRRRALAPMNGHYEWRTEGRIKQPYHIRRPDGGPYAVAALWETWQAEDGSEIDTAALLTTSPNATLEVIHDRMPLILAPEDWTLWLDPEAPLEAIDRLLGPALDDLLIGYKVGREVSRPGAQGQGLTEPLAAAELF
jgi:putative SOS response-associated peptidase YedK